MVDGEWGMVVGAGSGSFGRLRVENRGAPGRRDVRFLDSAHRPRFAVETRPRLTVSADTRRCELGLYL